MSEQTCDRCGGDASRDYSPVKRLYSLPGDYCDRCLAAIDRGAMLAALAIARNTTVMELAAEIKARH